MQFLELLNGNEDLCLLGLAEFSDVRILFWN
jgi:hypothetical protein